MRRAFSESLGFNRKYDFPLHVHKEDQSDEVEEELYKNKRHPQKPRSENLEESSPQEENAVKKNPAAKALFLELSGSDVEGFGDSSDGEGHAVVGRRKLRKNKKKSSDSHEAKSGIEDEQTATGIQDIFEFTDQGVRAGDFQIGPYGTTVVSTTLGGGATTTMTMMLSDEITPNGFSRSDYLHPRCSEPLPKPKSIGSISCSSKAIEEKEINNSLAATSRLSAASSSLLWGDLDGTQFLELGRSLGAGNSSTVNKAICLQDFNVYALKSVSINSSSFRKQMIKELNAYYAIQQNKTPYIVSCRGAFLRQSDIVFVLEYMNRGSLQDLLKQRGSVADERTLKRISKMVLLGLHHLHSNNLIHRDIKPANILINRAGYAKLADFGIVKKLDQAKETNTFLGTQIYMSPERLSAQPYSFSADIWSFGLTMQTLATGAYPYQSAAGNFLALLHYITKEPIPKLPRSKFSKEFRSFLSHALHKDAEQRWTAEKLLTHPFLEGVDVETPEHWMWERRSPHKTSDGADSTSSTRSSQCSVSSATSSSAASSDADLSPADVKDLEDIVYRIRRTVYNSSTPEKQKEICQSISESLHVSSRSVQKHFKNVIERIFDDDMPHESGIDGVLSL